MRKSLFILCGAMLTTGLTCAFDINIYSGEIPLPNSNGTFSGDSTSGCSVRHIYCVLTADKYRSYMNSATSAADIYSDVLSSGQGITIVYDQETIDGRSWIIDLSDYMGVQNLFGYDVDVYFAGVFIYVDAENNKTYYIARAVSEHTPLKSEDDNGWGQGTIVEVLDLAANAGRWEVIYNEPPSITCTDLCVTGGVVSATYSIPEFSRLNEVVSGEETSVIVAADLARTTQTNLAASITATNSVDSTFTFSFNPAEQNWTNSTLFIFGVEPPR